MSGYFAEVVEAGLELLCVATGHLRGCWILNRSPARRLYWWAIGVRHSDDPRYPEHAVCPTCGFKRDEYLPRSDYYDDVMNSYDAGMRDAKIAPTHIQPENFTAYTASHASTNFWDWPPRKPGDPK